MRSKRWQPIRSWVAALFAFALLGIHALALGHRHDEATADETCVVCDAIAHHSVDGPLPAPPALPAVPDLRAADPLSPRPAVADSAPLRHYLSRAPPPLSRQ